VQRICGAGAVLCAQLGSSNELRHSQVEQVARLEDPIEVGAQGLVVAAKSADEALEHDQRGDGEPGLFAPNLAAHSIPSSGCVLHRIDENAASR